LQAITGGTSDMDVKDKCALVQLQRKADDNAKIGIKETWRRPDQGWVKINFHAAYSEESFFFENPQEICTFFY
jgi:hypothetical protein